MGEGGESQQAHGHMRSAATWVSGGLPESCNSVASVECNRRVGCKRREPQPSGSPEGFHRKCQPGTRRAEANEDSTTGGLGA